MALVKVISRRNFLKSGSVPEIGVLGGIGRPDARSALQEVMQGIVPAVPNYSYVKTDALRALCDALDVQWFDGWWDRGLSRNT